MVLYLRLDVIGDTVFSSLYGSVPLNDDYVKVHCGHGCDVMVLG